MCREHIGGLGAGYAHEPEIHRPFAATQANMGELPTAQVQAAQLTALGNRHTCGIVGIADQS